MVGVPTPIPSLDEVTLGAFLHDIGKLGQRALSEDDLPAPIRDNETELLPSVGGGRYGYRHVLFTDLFFDLAEADWPRGIDRRQAREVAVYHHKPVEERPWTGLVSEADRLASGMERKERDAAHEAGLERGPGAFRTTPLLALQSRIRLAGTGARPATAWYPPRPLSADALMPVRSDPPPAAEMEKGYRRLWEAFLDGFRALAQAKTADHVHQGLLSLSERLLWAVPSSTVDEPDVSLHDHALAVAAIAACLYRFHEADGTLGDAAAIRDRSRAKFRLLEGDLSGIQDTLFRLERQQVRGINRILRGRSFRLQAITEAAALLVRRALALPPHVVLLRAGGRFTMVLPALPELEVRLAELRERFDRWLKDAYSGELALVLALSEPLSGAELMRGSWPETWRRFVRARETAKLRALAGVMEEPRIEVDFPAEGTCSACGVRPARHRRDDRSYCDSCDAEFDLGSRLPRARAVFWKPDDTGRGLFGEIRVEPEEVLPPALEADASAGFAIGFGERAEAGRPTALPWRLLASHVPTWRADEWDARRFEGAVETPEDIDELKAGGLVTMAHLARVDLEEVEGRLVGRPMLAVLKADVDDLGQIFARGLGRPEDRSLGRTVALSRLMDAFFSGWLPRTLAQDEDFRWIYTVYAGGDDLLLIGPWRTMLRFAVGLHEAFRRFSACNPDLHISAGIEFVDPDEPLNRSVRRAAERLERAKDAGKDRVSVIADEPLQWSQLERALGLAEEITELVRERRVPTTFLHRLLHFADLKARAERHGPPDLEAAMWNARLQYHLARQFPKDPKLQDFFRELIGVPGQEAALPARVPLSIAIWRNR